MVNSSDNSKYLTQDDYEIIVLTSIVELTNDNDSDGFQFSVSQIAKNLRKGNSVNRTMFAIKSLIDQELIGDNPHNVFSSGTATCEIEENEFAGIIDEDEHRFYVTSQGLYEFDRRIIEVRNVELKKEEVQARVLEFITSEASPHLRLLAYIYAKTRSTLELFCRLNSKKLSTDQMEVLSDLHQKGLIKTLFFEDAWTITEQGRQFLESESKTKALSLDQYIQRVKEMSLADIFDTKKFIS
ncbi:MAG TPA: hypothetical protein VMO00_12365 [Methylomirabilota bacterium]|nr:hypothetical protein [Methylomirabilota bacterium]